MDSIAFDATVYKVQTVSTDLGIRVTLDLSEECIPEMAMLAETKRKGIVLHFEARVSNATISEREIRKSKRAAS